MRAKTFARIKEAISASQPAANEAVASAQVRDIETARSEGSIRDGSDAARRAAMVSLGKKSILFRFGNAQNERSEAVEELAAILKGDGKHLPGHLYGIVASTALHELTFDKCPSCFGRGEVPDHSVEDLTGRQPMRICDTCMGQKRRRYNEDARIHVLARYIAADAKIDHENDQAYEEFVTLTAKELRSSRPLRSILSGVDYAKGILLDAERAAVEGAAVALEKARPE